jgi:hypothetical protein
MFAHLGIEISSSPSSEELSSPVFDDQGSPGQVVQKARELHAPYY